MGSIGRHREIWAHRPAGHASPGRPRLLAAAPRALLSALTRSPPCDMNSMFHTRGLPMRTLTGGPPPGGAALRWLSARLVCTTTERMCLGLGIGIGLGLGFGFGFGLGLGFGLPCART